MFREKGVRIAAWVVCSVLACFAVAPFVWVIATAFKTPAEINLQPPDFLPAQPTLENFHRILHDEHFLRYIGNSLVIALGSMVSILFTSSLAGFVFAKYRFPLRGLLFLVILATAIIPLEAYMIPLYIMVFKARMLNSYAALIFPMVIMTFGVFFMRQVIMGIPDELLEAARIDGASEFWIYSRIVLHLAKSGMMALGVFAFSEAWANFIWPLVIVSSKDMYTTELGLAVYQRQFFTEYGPVSAGAVISIVPMLLVFALLRRHIMQGIATTGLKG
ncbi:MAG: carbohydrate ABC transporter permease [Acidisphaera sp.]|nr:carbohydrate ABC transporter permease [Acidisphaera sp.]